VSESHKSKEKVLYVGDSRVRQGRSVMQPHDYSAYPGKSEAFVPNFLLKEWMVGVVVLVGFLVLTIAEPAPLGYPADPTNAAFIPMPDWYFLFLYQFLKYPYVSGNYVVLGTLGVPGVAFTALLIVPFLDTGKERRFYRRPVTSALMGLSLIAIVYLTMVSWNHYQHELEITNTIPEHIEREEKAREAADKGLERPNPNKPAELPALVDANDPAAALTQKAQCISCHGSDLAGSPPQIPALRGIGDQLSKDEIVDIVTNGKNNMPAFKDQLTAEEIDTLATWLSKQKAAVQ
jgi:menaquinol-cytochrome c reductase cytochrome b/c subunit